MHPREALFELLTLPDLGGGSGGADALSAVGLAFYLVVLGLVDRGGASLLGHMPMTFGSDPEHFCLS